MRFTRIILTVLAVCALTLGLSLACADSSGNCGTGVTWTLDSAGTLTIRGSGRMENYQQMARNNGPIYTSAPWGTDVKKLVVEQGVICIGKNAFYGCSQLSSISLPYDMVIIEDYAFTNCTSLTTVRIPDGVITIGQYAFSGCTNLQSAILPDTVENFNTHAFGDCVALKEINFPRNLGDIESYAFQNCKKLVTVSVPANVRHIGTCAFNGCTHLQRLSLCRSRWLSMDIEPQAIPASTTIYCYESPAMAEWARSQGYKTVEVDNLASATEVAAFASQQPVYTAGESHTLTGYIVFPVVPANVMTYQVSDPSIAEVTTEGLFRAYRPGTVQVTVTVNGQSLTYPVTVASPPVLATDFVLDDIWVIVPGNPQAEVTALQPADAGLSLAWHSSNPSCAAVDADGVLTCAEVGEATLTVTDRLTGLTRSATVHVCPPVTGMAFEKPDNVAQVDVPVQLNVILTMGDQTCVNHFVEFSHDGMTNVEITQDCVFIAHAPGYYHVFAWGPGMSTSCSIKVVDRSILILPDQLTTIESGAFSGVKDVAIYIPDRVTEIADDAFDKDDVLLIVSSISDWPDWAREHGIPYTTR